MKESARNGATRTSRQDEGERSHITAVLLIRVTLPSISSDVRETRTHETPHPSLHYILFVMAIQLSYREDAHLSVTEEGPDNFIQVC